MKQLDIRDFRDIGFLQEVNRTFFHPLGLALEFVTWPDGDNRFCIYDYRDQPEGMSFAPDALDPEKTDRVRAEFLRHFHVRLGIFGGTHIQPVPTLGPSTAPLLPVSLVPEL